MIYFVCVVKHPESIDLESQIRQQTMLTPIFLQISYLQRLLLIKKSFLKLTKNTNFHKLQFFLISTNFSLNEYLVFLEEYFQENKLKLTPRQIISKGEKKSLKSLMKKSLRKNRRYNSLLLSLLLKLVSNFSQVVLLSFFFSPFTIFPKHQRIPKRHNIKNINNPLIIKKSPDNKEGTSVPYINNEICPPINAINPNIMKISGTPYEKILKNILAAIPIHQYLVTSKDLKQLWVSLSSKETMVFDTPGKDAHLPLFFISVFYVCKSLNGEQSITSCHSRHYLGSYTSPKRYMGLFCDGGGF